MNKKVIVTDNAPKAIGPYSQGIIANGLIFLSGQIPIDPKTGDFVDGDITQQTEQVIINIISILKEAETALSDVVKTTVFLKDLASFAEMNEVYEQYFKHPFPARSTVEVSHLPKGALVEIEVIAVKNNA